MRIYSADKALHEMIRLFSKIDITDDCWRWMAARSSDGYGSVWSDGACWGAHQLLWAIYHGDIPDGLEIDHLCKNRWCVNPDHMELVTHKENVLRGDSPGAAYARRATCDRGHLFDRGRPCGKCVSENKRAYYLEKREKIVSYMREHRAKNRERINARRRELKAMKRLEC